MSSVVCTQEMEEHIAKIDLIVFDVDGVLIDTLPSFIATIVNTTRFYINSLLRLPIDLSRLTIKDALTFKQYTGFNNDWDLTEGMVSYRLFKHKCSNSCPDLIEFLDEASTMSAGVNGINELLKGKCSEDVLSWIQNKVDKLKIKKVFQEIYGGDDNCESLYEFRPEFYSGVGSVESETALLDRELLNKWSGKIGILTGRMKNETEFALKMLKFDKIDRNLVRFTDLMFPDKPDPAKMIQIVHNAQSKCALFIGDSIDDYLTVINFDKSGAPGDLRFGLVTESGRNFPEEAQQFTASSVNDLLGFIEQNNENFGSDVRE